ncbi:MAG: SRPBCC family protein [Iamia sp.]
MPRIEATTRVSVSVEDAFAVSQSQQEVRYAWDPFVREQRLLGGATRPDKGVRTRTTSRHRLTMVSQYTSFRAPHQVGMKMVEGPWFFSAFGGGWSFKELGPEECEAVWRYTFTVRPAWLAPIADRIGRALLQRDIDRRLAGFAGACADPDIVARARAQLAA